MPRIFNSLAVTVLMAICLVCTKINAAVITITEGSTSGYALTDGNTYVVQNSVEFSNSTVGGSGMSVADNATVVLYVPAGVTLTAVGAHGSGRIGGGAGIHVPETATLVITGEGTVNATGGNAGDGGDGEDGANGGSIKCGYGSTEAYGSGSSGGGGSGGCGGGGAGAGVGGFGGCGGNGGAGGVARVVKDLSLGNFSKNGNSGYSGENGVDGSGMGECYVIGRVRAAVFSGESGKGGNSGKSGDWVYYFYDRSSGNDYHFATSGGGGGGGGGAGSAPTSPWGGGGSSGGGGGGGGSGATAARNSSGYDYYSLTKATGGGGTGGISSIAQGETGGTKGKTRGGYYYAGSAPSYYYGGDGGIGGAAGMEGAAGRLYVSPTAIVNADREKLSAVTHSAVQYTIIFNANGGALQSSVKSLTATLGCELPDCIPTPIRAGYIFEGWRTSYGEEYYGVSGIKSKSSYHVADDVVLDAQWRIDEKYVIPGNTFWFRENAETGWFVDSEVAEGEVLRSGAIGNSTNSWMGTTIVGPASFSFDWRVSCNARGHYLVWFIDGEEQSRIRGETEWATVSASIPDGEHEIRFYYVKGSTSESGEDKGQIRNFAIDSMRIDTEMMQVTWDWTTNYWVECSVVGKGSTSFGAQWVVDGTNLTIPFSVNTPFYSLSLSGDAHGVVVGDGCLSLSVTSPRSIVLTVTEYTYSTALDSGWLLWNSGGAANWIAQGDESYDGSSAVRSGEVIGDDVSTISTIVTGPGTLRWWWKLDMTDCAGVDVFVDESFVSSLDYVSDWRAESIEITSEGRHTVRFEFWNAGNGAALSDHAYMDKVSWMPIKSEIDHTTTTLVPVPHSYFEMNYPTLLGMHGGDCESAALATAANGRKVWECFMLGLDPTKAGDEFKITRFWMENGKPMFEFSHSVDGAGNSFVPRIKAKGKAKLTDSWSDVPDGGDPSFRFFTVEVALP